MRAILAASPVMEGLCINCPLPSHARAVTKSSGRTAPKVTASACRATSRTAERSWRRRPVRAATKSPSYRACTASRTIRRAKVTAIVRRVTTSTSLGLAQIAQRAWPATKTSPPTNPTPSAAPAATRLSLDGDGAYSKGGSVRILIATAKVRSRSSSVLMASPRRRFSKPRSAAYPAVKAAA